MENGRYKFCPRQGKFQMLTMCVQTHFFWQLNWGATGISSKSNPSTQHISLSDLLLLTYRSPQSLRKHGYTLLFNSPLSPFYEYLVSHKEKLSVEKLANGIILCYRQQWSIFPFILDIERVYTGYVCTQSLGSQGRTVWNSKPSSAIQQVWN